jgi:hypothetical protein
MTIHITPEPAFSYVSFESNIAAASYGDLISRVIDTFNPGKFIVTVFANKVIFRVFIFICTSKIHQFSIFRHHQLQQHLVNWKVLVQSVIGVVTTSSFAVLPVTI